VDKHGRFNDESFVKDVDDLASECLASEDEHDEDELDEDEHDE
jgi:hypothetical protein